MSVQNGKEPEEYKIPQYMESTNQLDNVDPFLRCICVQRSTHGEVDHTLERLKGSRAGERVRAGQWFGVGLLNTISGTLKV